MSTSEPWTIGRLLNWTTQYLKRHGSETPRLDAEVLLAHVRGCQRIELYTAFDVDPGEEARVAFRELVRALQDMRKKMGLTPSDLIKLTLPDNHKKLIEKFESDLKKAALVSELVFEGEEIKIDKK